MRVRIGALVPVFPRERRMAERVRVREITNDEGNRLLRTVRRSSGSVVTWRRAQKILLSAQGMDVSMIAQVTFTSPDRCAMGSTTSTSTGSTPCVLGRPAVALRRRRTGS